MTVLGTGCIGLAPEHTDLRDSVRELTRRHLDDETRWQIYDAQKAALPAIWTELAAQGLLGLHLSEAVGGAGYGLMEAAVVAEELGRAAMPGPFLPTIIASAVLAAGGAQELLPGLATGELVAGMAARPGRLTATQTGNELNISGESEPALSAPLADVMLLPVMLDAELRWVWLQAGQFSVDEAESVDVGRRAGTVTVTEPVSTSQLLEVDPQLPLEYAAALFAAEASGMADATTQIAAEYATVREQFGRPIGQFQAIKHRCAAMFAEAERARVCAWDAIRGLDELHAGTIAAPQASLAIAVAAAAALDASLENAKAAVQVLGGIGFTWEHVTGFYLRRAHTARVFIGLTEEWYERVAALALAGVRRQFRIELPAAAEARRDQVRQELAHAASLDAAAQRQFLAEQGYVAPHYPQPWGRGADAATQLMIAEELAAAQVVPYDMIIGNWVLPTLIEHGSAAQQQRFVPPTLTGEVYWCQLFSEPGAGSDLAALSTKAVKVEGGWEVTGQKIWTSGATHSQYGILLARTDTEVPKHQGISYFLVDMTSAGIDIRPIRELTGDQMFNEVFLDRVFIPDDMLVGQPGDGWRLALTTLANERVSMNRSSGLGDTGEWLLKAVGEHPSSARRTQLGALLVDAAAGGLLELRSVLRAVGGLTPGAEASIAKLAGTSHTQDVAEVLAQWQGMDSAYGEMKASHRGWWFLNTRSLSIAGGSTEIQLNIIAERLLGLPRDP